MLRIAFWSLVAIAIVAVIYLVYSGKYLHIQKIWKRKSTEPGDELANLARDKAKVVDLPFQVETAHKTLIAYANDSLDKGLYSQAVIALFGHMLIELDAASCIRLQRGKTNRVYWRELKSEPKLRSLFNDLSYVFEAVYFGKYPISKGECEQYWRIIPELDKSIESAKRIA